jgi:uncharacterized protein YchJ
MIERNLYWNGVWRSPRCPNATVCVSFVDLILTSFSFCYRNSQRLNMYDNFDLNKCHIVEESYDEEGEDKKAAVKFVAEMMLRESGETTGFMETSQFERAKTHGGWLYLNGTMESAPEELLLKNLDTGRKE